MNVNEVFPFEFGGVLKNDDDCCGIRVTHYMLRDRTRRYRRSELSSLLFLK